MQTRSHNTFTSIHTEGSLLLADKDLDGLTPANYHLPGREELNEAINCSWDRLEGGGGWQP